MVEYLVIPTPFSDTASLLAAVKETFIKTKPDLHVVPVLLKDKAGQPQAHRAHIVIKVDYRPIQAEFGFVRNPVTGTFSFLLPEVDRGYFLNHRLYTLTQAYRTHLKKTQLELIKAGQAKSIEAIPIVAPFLNEQHRTKTQALLLKDFWQYPWSAEENYLEGLVKVAVKHQDIVTNARLVSGMVAFTGFDSVQQIAMPFLQALTSQEAIDKVCLVWKDSRHPTLEKLLIEHGWVATSPDLVKVLTAFKTNQPEQLHDLPAKEAKLLLMACEDSEPVIAERARAYLQGLTNPALLEVIVSIWLDTRARSLWQLIEARKYLPSRPVKAKVLVGLKLGTREIEETLANGPAGIVDILVEACADQDAAIREAAPRVVAQLKRVPAQEVLCKIVIEQNLPAVEQIVRTQGYLPADLHQKILFFFVTGQWEQYDRLDFDRSQLQRAYQTASPAFKRRIAEKVRQAGRPEYLEIITGAGYHFGRTEISPEEAELTVEVLTANRDWDNLWPLVFQVNLKWSSLIVAQLIKVGWQPGPPEERKLFEELKPLVESNGFSDETLQGYKALPPALLRAEGKIIGRINGLAFSPVRPVIAFSTGTRKVVIWNIQTAQREAILTGAVHSIGQIVFTSAGKLICAEHTTKWTSCNLYYWEGKGTELIRFGQHDDTITVLHALNETEVISSGRDEQLKLWQLGNATEKLSIQLPIWPRTSCVSKDGKQLALWLNRRVQLVSLPDLNLIAEFWTKSGEMARAIAFAPDENTIIAGKFNSGLAIYTKKPKTHTWASVPNDISLGTSVQDLTALPQHDLLIAANTHGFLSFLEARNGLQARGQVWARHYRLTSLTVSPDQTFMATGDSEASFSLWDLRVLETDQLFERPLAQAVPSQLTALNLRLENESITPTAWAKPLQYLKLVLQYRLRYNIELAEDIPSIKAGFFDIEIEG